MTNTKTTKLLLSYLFSQGHSITGYEEGKYVETVVEKQEYIFACSRDDVHHLLSSDNKQLVLVTYTHPVFHFQVVGRGAKSTDLSTLNN